MKRSGLRYQASNLEHRVIQNPLVIRLTFARVYPSNGVHRFPQTMFAEQMKSNLKAVCDPNV